jgi:DNA-binding MarR family transcriptional regulator
VSKDNSSGGRRSRHAKQATQTEPTVRELLLVMPRLVGRVKRLAPPEALRSLDLAPRHLSLLSYLVFDGPLTISQLAQRLEIAPTTVSLLVSELDAKGVLVRRADDADRRRRIVDIAEAQRAAIDQWLAPGMRAWQQALGPLTPAERSTFVATLRAYERAVSQSKNDSSGAATRQS